MRICILIDAWDPIWGGGQTHIWEIAKRLCKKGYKIDIFTQALKEGNQKSVAGVKTFFNGNLRIIRLGPITSFGNPMGRLSWLIQVPWIVFAYHQQEQYELVHAHAYLPAIPGKILQFLLRIPLLYTVHGSHNLDTNKKNVKTYLERILLTKIKYDSEISVSRRLLTYPNVNKNILILANGVELAKFDGVHKTKRLHKLFRFLWVGRYDWIKGVEILLHAFKIITDRNTGVQLVLVGYGFEKDKYIKLVRTLGIEKFVRFIKKKTGKQLVYMYKSADIFVLPSLAEGQAVTLFEAWAAKLPVIVSDAGEHKLLVKNDINGYLVKAGDVDELVIMMEKAIRNPSLKSLGIHGYKMVREKYTWDMAAKKQAEYYTQLA